MVLGHYRAILSGTRFCFGEFNCCKICSFIVGRFVVFPLYLFGTVLLLVDL